MKQILYFLFYFIPVIILAQKYDNIWVVGDNNSLTDSTRGGSVIDFHYHPPKVYYNYRELNLRACNASICDTAGNLMFYSNGCAIAGANDELLENGAGLNPGDVYEAKCTTEGYYTSGYQSVLTLPTPNSNNIYYLFHKKTIYLYNPFDIKVDKLFYSIIDMDENAGKGRVIAKNIEIMSDDIAYGQMTAVKHANGKDWWLVTPKDDSNTFYIFLFTQDGIVDTLEQTIGTAPPVNASGGIQMVFSPDGSKLFRSIPSGPVLMYDFDRTTGAFTHFDSIAVDYKNWPSVANGFAVSPNGRFIYVCAELNIFQFDLWAADISASQVTVAEWDGFKAPVGTIFGQSQLGPDCKIYVSTIDCRYYHVINNPDEPGLDCNVTQHSFVFPTPTGASIPSFPNYRLGPLDNPGVPCSATVSANGPASVAESGVAMYPNPANNEVIVEYDTKASFGKQLLFFNVYGQLVRIIQLNNGDGKIVVGVNDLPSGIYWYALLGSKNANQSGKIIIQH